jgi:hypothetical protein
MQHNLFFSPYRNERLDKIYNLQFCDIVELLEPELSQRHLLCKLVKQELTQGVLQSLAMSGDEDARVRILAFNQMRQQTLPVPLKILLGVIIEVGLAEGLETLAVFEDEKVRYISAEKRLAVVESPTPPMELLIHKLLRDSQKIINGLSPCTEARHHPPTFGRARFTFIASDGIYLGEGQFKTMQANPQAAELIDDALDLLHEIIMTGSTH